MKKGSKCSEVKPKYVCMNAVQLFADTDFLNYLEQRPTSKTEKLKLLLPTASLQKQLCVTKELQVNLC